MLFLNAAEVRRALPMPDAVAAMKLAFRAIADGTANLPLRTHIDVPDHAGTTLVMPAYVRSAEMESLTVKVVSVFGNNPTQHRLPRIQAAVLVLDPSTGLPQALLEGSTLTGIRTAAASGAATDVLARPDSHRLAILGAGVQARTHIAAMLAVRPIQSIRCWSRTPDSVHQLVAEMRAEFAHCEFLAAETANQAIADADIVCTVSTSAEPLFDAAVLPAGCHLNVVGSYQPHVREVPSQTVVAARVYVDEVQSALEEAGDLIQPIQEGLITPDHIVGSIGQVLLGELPGRRSPQEITLFKSVGNAAEDALAAATVLRNARDAGTGTTLEL